MNFQFTAEQRLFQESVGKFAQKFLADGAVARANSREYPWDVSRQLAEQGLLGLTIPVESGGHGGSLIDAVIAIEQVTLACPKSGDVVQAGNFGAIRTFAEYASKDQKERFLPDLINGTKVISVAMTEPGAGSATTELTTSAKPDGKGFRINGSKIFTTNSPHAELFLLYVRFGPGVGGIGSVLVERNTPGFTLGETSAFMNGETWQQLYFEDCYIPAENVLLPAGGFKKQISGFNVERLGNATRSLAVGQLAFNIASRYVDERRQFGRRLSDFQGMQWKFAEMALKLESARLLLYRAAINASTGLPSAYETAIAKLACNRTGYEVANDAMQAMGGLGFSEDCLVQYCMRRARGWMIAGGSSEILLNRIAESVFNRPLPQRQASLEAAQ
ncbi:MAG: acyl-CoA dehydrogenase family protein [Afipia sp.]|nr:acyl-CoA dehydrogenase family protein [Afipia sp.]OJW64006.1 MAG: acyl-CoA dehydrogenase [Afipia sp. 64-13]